MKRSLILDFVSKGLSYVLCVCFALYFTVQCIQHFMLDEDVTKIEYRKFLVFQSMNAVKIGNKQA